MNVNIHIEGLAAFKARLKRYPEIAAPEFDRAVKKTIMDIKKGSMEQTPVDTGRLRSSHETNFSKLYGEVGPTADYAIYVHEGTRYMRSRPFLRSAVEGNQDSTNKNFGEALENVIKKIAN